MNGISNVFNDRPLGTHAVVIGGSMAGLMNARILSDHFERVTVLERDAVPSSGSHRKGVPQARHVHGLLTSGLLNMNTLFPGLTDDLAAAGAIQGDSVGDMKWFQFGRFKASFESGLGGVLMSRTLLEQTVRNRASALPNVTFRERCSVESLMTVKDGQHVVGVELRGGEEIYADLVVDATGRGSRSPAWLEALGYPTPDEDEIAVRVGYTSRTYRRQPGELDGKIGAVIATTPPEGKRVGVALALEDGRWHVTLMGWLGDHAPADEAGFRAFTRSLPMSDIYDIVRDAEPLTDFAVHTFPANLRRRYERLERFPTGYLVFGDALCSFNPIYGQGMSVAALEAVALGECLATHRSGLHDLAPRFFKRAARIIDGPWEIAAGADLLFPEVDGHRPFGSGFVNGYIRRVHEAAADDEAVCQAFFRVANLLAAPTSLFHPAVVARVLRATMRRRSVPTAAVPGFAPAAPRTAAAPAER